MNQKTDLWWVNHELVIIGIKGHSSGKKESTTSRTEEKDESGSNEIRIQSNGRIYG
jgi:sugar lactone lactonase YvrE